MFSNEQFTTLCPFILVELAVSIKIPESEEE
jgi:hypothetical protein